MSAAAFLMYVGTYTGGGSEGIYLCSFNPTTGEIVLRGLAARANNPTFLAIERQKRFLYAVGESGGPKGGTVRAFAIDRATGELRALNQQSSGGPGPCHVSVEATSRYLYVANYSGGSVAALPIREGGGLGEASAVVPHEGRGPHPKRQTRAHAHSANVDPANRFLLVADLGIDKVMVYRLDTDGGTLPAHEVPFTETAPGAGPRHLDFHPNGTYVYLINELGNTMTAYAYDAGAGTLKEINTLPTLPEGFTGSSTCADVHVSPDGRYLYGSNRGHDSIVIYRIDQGTGAIELAGHASTRGAHPRNFAIDPTGRYLLAANRDTNNIVVFAIDADTGGLTPTGHGVEVPKPVCIRFL